MPPRHRSKPRSPLHRALGEAIKELREVADLTHEELADRDSDQAGHCVAKHQPFALALFRFHAELAKPLLSSLRVAMCYAA